jgi:hypothetical protein
MGFVSVFYAGLGYLALLAAILAGMLFMGDGSVVPGMDAGPPVAPLEGALVDTGLLLLLALLHGSARRGNLRRLMERSIPPELERSTQAWIAAAALVLLYVCWKPLPHSVWNLTGPAQAAISGLFFLGWTLILIGAFLTGRLEGALDALRGGLFIAAWATSSMSAGHLVLAAALTIHLVFDSLREGRAHTTRTAYSLQRHRLARQRVIRTQRAGEG